MSLTTDNLLACCDSKLNGKKYGGVRAGNNLRIVPSQRLTRFVLNAEQYGFRTDTLSTITSERAGEYLRRLGPLGKGVEINPQSNYTFFQRGGCSQICEITPQGRKLVLDLSERLSFPTTEVFKNTGINACSVAKTGAKNVWTKVLKAIV